MNGLQQGINGFISLAKAKAELDANERLVENRRLFMFRLRSCKIRGLIGKHGLGIGSPCYQSHQRAR